MALRFLTDNQIDELFAPPIDQAGLVRHCTLSDTDLALVQRRHNDGNRLRFALMLCYLRFPGRPLRPTEQPSQQLLAFVGGQIGVHPNRFAPYPLDDRQRLKHLEAVRDQLGLQPFGRYIEAEMSSDLLPQAIENDRLMVLAKLVMQECRERKVVAPSIEGLQRFCVNLRLDARREVYRRLTNGLSPGQRQQLDGLLKQRDNYHQTWLGWLRQRPQATKAAAMNGLIERLRHVRNVGLDPALGCRVHRTRLAQLVRETERTTVQHIANYEPHRRHAALTAIILDSAAGLTDQAIDLFDRLISQMFRKAEHRQADAFRSDAKAINEKVRLFASVGKALIAAHDEQNDPFAAIASIVPWEKFQASVAEAEALARSETFDVLQKLPDRYPGIRRWSPAFLETFAFDGIPATSSLLLAIDLLRDVNTRKAARLPKTAPTGFIKQRWSTYVLPLGGGIDRRYYEICVLSELRDRLRAGDIWVRGSRQYRSFEERLIPVAALQEMQAAETLPLAIEHDFEKFIAQKRAQLDERLTAVNAAASINLLPDVAITNGVLKITPIEKSTPLEAEALAKRLYAMLPRIRITDLMMEVNGWTDFADCFTHLKTGATAADSRILMAGLLADGLNLGLTRTAIGPMKTSSTAPLASICSSLRSSFGTRDIWSRLSLICAKSKRCQKRCSNISRRLAGSISI